MDPDSSARLGRTFLSRDTATVARELLGTILWHRSGDEVVAGRIVETEAYLGADDDASHAAWSKRGRPVMEGRPGTIYMYCAYGIHSMFNIVTEVPRTPGAVLIRAAEPVAGIDVMSQRRGTHVVDNLCSGPGKLCQAFDLPLDLTGVDLLESQELQLTHGFRPTSVSVGPRIGITRSAELPLRFFVSGNRHVSAHRREVHF